MNSNEVKIVDLQNHLHLIPKLAIWHRKQWAHSGDD